MELKKKIVDACFVVDEDLWKKYFPSWEPERLATERIEERPLGELAWFFFGVMMFAGDGQSFPWTRVGEWRIALWS